MFGTGGLSTWIQDNIIPVILLVIAAGALWAGKNGNISKIVTMLVCVALGLAILALATTGAGKDLGTWLVSLFRA
ncbi:hypothetical protein H9623_17920 [Oerskovia sp. Sa1BUA8]|uniref:Uncharacterized protein n=2 Tax=Oerskovia TaxID=162491 RepID=A0A9D5UFL7_9CELL|nr:MULTISPECIES: hypothetical protein [Oerskovia]MBD7982752.1 hypothetical protein [Oerskovia merdavium]MBE7702171.1 hypothetical protein [Oerskovia douganii]